MSDQKAGRIFIGFFMSIFGMIGITVLVSLWAAPFGDFGSPPLIFRLVGSFIALAFIAFGVFGVYGAIAGKAPTPDTSTRAPGGSGDATANDQLACPKCGASVGADTEISPSGDVKCPYCSSWFNVRA